MNLLRNSIILLSLSFLMSSCEKEAKEKVVSNNENFNVELLFEVDGCKVYRFMDGIHPRYFSNCKGNINYTEISGKTTNDVNIPTNTSY